MIDTTIGSYRIVGKLGAGGMGEVYRARDSKLNRDVAIKVLPEVFAADAERLARFTREAQALASLNHPNIATIYGVEESSGVRALVMELVEGDDLSFLVARGALPIAEALPIARQIADALEAAHEQGIVHRDLKPANVKVRHDGTVKVLDFGLAKALDSSHGSGLTAHDSANSPTLTVQGTMAGTVIGTAAYMAPEQARGKPVDRRADIWAFGVVLYEMLTGTRLFEGESVAETLGLIFSREPDLTALPPATPPAIRDLVSRCLVKDPKQRLRDMGEARQQIEGVLSGRGSGSTTAPPASSPAMPVVRPHRAAWAPWLAVPIVAVAAAAAAWFARPMPASPAIRLSIALPPGDQATTIPAITPDGRLVAYAAGRSTGSSRLYLRGLGEGTSRVVASSDGALFPFFSPDGRSVAFFAGGTLRVASVDGGASTDTASAPVSWGGTWTADGLVFTSGLGSGLLRVAPTGGPVEQLTKPDGAANGYAHVFPVSLPGTKDLLFGFWGQTFYGARYSAATHTSSAVTTPVRLLAGVPLYAGGFLMGNDGVGGVLATRWTPDTQGQVTLTTPVLEHVQWGLNYDRSWLAVSSTGTAVYVAGNPNDRHVVWVDRQGRETPVTAEPDLIHQATLSHDGTRVAYGSMRSQWTVDLRSGARTRLISEFRSWHGAWLPGDERLAVSSNKDGDWDLYTIAATGGEMTLLLKRPWAQHVMAVGTEGSIVFLERNPASGSDLLILTPDQRVVPLLVTPYNEFGASLSPDGRYVAYVTDESGRNEVFVMPMPKTGLGPRVPVSVEGGTGPVWSRDGNHLFYRGGDDQLVDAQVRTGQSGLSLGERRKLLDLSPYDSGFLHELDVSPDGQRFLVIRTDPGSRPYRLDVIINWFDELRRKFDGTGEAK